MKKAARLTGSLLARKGFANPSPAVPSLSHPSVIPAASVTPNPGSVTESYDAGHQEVNDEAALESAIESVQKLADVQKNAIKDEKPEVEVAEDKEPDQVFSAPKPQVPTFGRKTQTPPTGKVETSQKKKPSKTANIDAEEKRIAMTLRMEKDSHLKLRLFSAHSNKSCQEILTEALDAYFQENNQVISKSECPCLAE